MDSYKNYTGQFLWRVPENIHKVLIKRNNSSFFFGSYFNNFVICGLGKASFLDADDIMVQFSEMGYNCREYIFISEESQYQITFSKGIYS